MKARNVSELTEITTVDDSDNILISQNNAAKRITFANLKTVLTDIIGKVTSLVDGLMSKEDKSKLDTYTGTSFDTDLATKATKDDLLNQIEHAIDITKTDANTCIPSSNQLFAVYRLSSTASNVPSVDNMDWLVTSERTLNSNNSAYIKQTAKAINASTSVSGDYIYIRSGYFNSDVWVFGDWVQLDTVVARTTALNTKQDTLTAGSNISIIDNVISAVSSNFAAEEINESISHAAFASDTRIFMTADVSLTMPESDNTLGVEVLIYARGSAASVIVNGTTYTLEAGTFYKYIWNGSTWSSIDTARWA